MGYTRQHEDEDVLETSRARQGPVVHGGATNAAPAVRALRFDSSFIFSEASQLAKDQRHGRGADAAGGLEPGACGAHKAKSGPTEALGDCDAQASSRDLFFLDLSTGWSHLPGRCAEPRTLVVGYCCF